VSALNSVSGVLNGHRDLRPWLGGGASGSHDGMKLLLIESTPGNATAIAGDLAANGHEVLSCTDEHGGPCRGVAHHADCPLDGHVDLTIVARQPGSTHTLDEMGAVCAARHRVPTVEVDPLHPADDLPDLTVASALAARKVEAAYAQAIRNELGGVPALVDVRREPTRIVANVQVPAAHGTPQGLSAVADRARKAVREHDPYVGGIDINVVCYPDPD